MAIDRSWGSPNVLHDGVSVAKEISKINSRTWVPQLVKEAASKTNDVAETVQPQPRSWLNIAGKGMKYVTAGTNPNDHEKVLIKR